MARYFDPPPTRGDAKHTVGWIAFYFFVIAVFISGIIFLTPLRLVLFSADSAARAYERTFDAENVIYNYERFHDLYNNTEALKKKIVTAEEDLKEFKADMGPRSEWDFNDKEEYSRLRMIVTGLKHHREDLVSEYNSNAEKANRKIFLDNNLPERLE